MDKNAKNYQDIYFDFPLPRKTRFLMTVCSCRSDYKLDFSRNSIISPLTFQEKRLIAKNQAEKTQ